MTWARSALTALASIDGLLLSVLQWRNSAKQKFVSMELPKSFTVSLVYIDCQRSVVPAVT